MYSDGFPSEKKNEIKVSFSVSFEQNGEITLLGSKNLEQVTNYEHKLD